MTNGCSLNKNTYVLELGSDSTENECNINSESSTVFEGL